MSLYSYEAPGFAGFYDLMVEDLTKKGVIGQPDVEFYHNVLAESCQAQEKGVFLDLATGTGRVVFDTVDRLKSTAVSSGEEGAGEQCFPCRFLDIWGVDHSQEMLAAAERKAKRRLAIDRLPAYPTVSITWAHGNLATLDIPQLHHSCNLVTVSAGSFHHLITREDQVKALKAIRDHMVEGPLSRAVIDIFNGVELVDASPSALEVGPYRREQLQNNVKTVSDGGIVAESRFRLSHADAKPQPPSDDSPYTSMGNALEEHWSLRVIHVPEFMQLAQEAGLLVLAKSSTFCEAIEALKQSVKGGQSEAAVVNEEGPCVFVLGVRQ